MSSLPMKSELDLEPQMNDELDPPATLLRLNDIDRIPPRDAIADVTEHA